MQTHCGKSQFMQPLPRALARDAAKPANGFLVKQSNKQRDHTTLLDKQQPIHFFYLIVSFLNSFTGRHSPIQNNKHYCTCNEHPL